MVGDVLSSFTQCSSRQTLPTDELAVTGRATDPQSTMGKLKTTIRAFSILETINLPLCEVHELLSCLQDYLAAVRAELHKCLCEVSELGHSSVALANEFWPFHVIYII